MSVADVVEKTIELGSEIILTYGPRLLRKIYHKKISTRTFSVVVFNFFSREEYEKVYDILMRMINDFREKEGNKKVLNIDGWNFDYDLSISLVQDDLMIANLLEDFLYEAFLSIEPLEEKIDTSLSVSSARFSLMPRLGKKELELNEFKNMLESLFKLYRSIDKKILDYMKSGALGPTKTTLFVILTFEEEVFLKSKKYLLNSYDYDNRIHVDLNNKRIRALIDDTSVIEALMKLLR